MSHQTETYPIPQYGPVGARVPYNPRQCASLAGRVGGRDSAQCFNKPGFGPGGLLCPRHEREWGARAPEGAEA